MHLENRKNAGTNMTKRTIELKGLGINLDLSKFATPRTDKEFIHLDKLPDGTWRLLFNVKGVTDTANLEALVIHRD